MPDKSDNQWGGKRDGAGRPTIYEQHPRRAITVAASDSEWKWMLDNLPGNTRERYHFLRRLLSPKRRQS